MKPLKKIINWIASLTLIGVGVFTVLFSFLVALLPVAALVAIAYAALVFAGAM